MLDDDNDSGGRVNDIGPKTKDSGDRRQESRGSIERQLHDFLTRDLGSFNENDDHERGERRNRGWESDGRGDRLHQPFGSAGRFKEETDRSFRELRASFARDNLLQERNPVNEQLSLERCLRDSIYTASAHALRSLFPENPLTEIAEIENAYDAVLFAGDKLVPLTKWAIVKLTKSEMTLGLSNFYDGYETFKEVRETVKNLKNYIRELEEGARSCRMTYDKFPTIELKTSVDRQILP